MKIGSFWVPKEPSKEVEPFTKGAKYRITDHNHRMFSERTSRWVDAMLVENIDDPTDVIEVTEECFKEFFREVTFELVSSHNDMKNE